MLHVPFPARPLPLLGILLLWLWDAVSAFALSLPFVFAVERVYAHHPDGDAPLWQPGGLDLADLFVQSQPLLAVLVPCGLLSLLVVGVLRQFLAALLFLLLNDPAPFQRALRRPRLLLRAFTLFRPLCILWVGARLLQGAWLGGGYLVGIWLSRTLEPHSPQGADFAVGGIGLLVLGGLFLLCIGRGLASAAVVHVRQSLWRSLCVASQCFRTHAWALCCAWGWRAVLYVGGIGGIALAAQHLAGESDKGVVLFCLHQAVLLVGAALHLSWVACTLRFARQTWEEHVAFSFSQDVPVPRVYSPR